MISLQTNLGEIVIELYHDSAPITCSAIEQYVKEGFYDGMVFHRVIRSFIIQTGGFKARVFQQPKFKPEMFLEKVEPTLSIPREDNDLKNVKYSIALSRNPMNDEACVSQFYINVNNNQYLDTEKQHGYTVFGEVIGGREIVDLISEVQTDSIQVAGSRKILRDCPIDNVVIIKAVVKEN